MRRVSVSVEGRRRPGVWCVRISIRVACGYLRPCDFLPCISLGLSRGGMGVAHRLEPDDLGLRWKEGVRMMKSYRTCLTPHPMEKRLASLETPG